LVSIYACPLTAEDHRQPEFALAGYGSLGVERRIGSWPLSMELGNAMSRLAGGWQHELSVAIGIRSRDS
jgi:hypothetical protein